MKDEAAERWERTYSQEGKRWGDEPGELARVVVARLKEERAGDADGAPARPLRILDVGCGYGRDSVHLARELRAAVTGIDPAAKAIELACGLAPSDLSLEYRRAVIGEVDDGPYDAVFTANTYHVLRPPARLALAARTPALLLPGGFFFLSTLATGDREHYGRGRPVAGDDESWLDGETYLHFSSAASLQREFGAFVIERLVRHAFTEPHAGGTAHDHVHWLMVARKE
jgi:2-polyprenyl-3-methyl-5-hydroxy-6-metoxy-1,4-benzoquinol methylase